ncbi:MAG: hypothetical protein Unbinned4811contig1001_20 [Prokaryotic dsDNA virus sp.]|nr:MAG: hypothetical protein Unbinned4811contig1001_20 [Prokaryotic dsDNA virus sp.]
MEVMVAGLDQLIKAMFAVLIVSVPLGLWKLIDIAVWIFDHVSVDFG